MSRGLYHQFANLPPDQHRSFRYTPLMQLGTEMRNANTLPYWCILRDPDTGELEQGGGRMRVDYGLDRVGPECANDTLLFAASSYCFERILEFKTRPVQNHRARVGAKFYQRWFDIIAKTLSDLNAT